MSLIKFTPEQRAAISKAMTQFFINNGTYAYDSLKNDWGGGKYIKGDYKDISGEPLFDKLWDKAFVDPSKYTTSLMMKATSYGRPPSFCCQICPTFTFIRAKDMRG